MPKLHPAEELSGQARAADAECIPHGGAVLPKPHSCGPEEHAGSERLQIQVNTWLVQAVDLPLEIDFYGTIALLAKRMHVGLFRNRNKILISTWRIENVWLN